MKSADYVLVFCKVGKYDATTEGPRAIDIDRANSLDKVLEVWIGAKDDVQPDLIRVPILILEGTHLIAFKTDSSMNWIVLKLLGEHACQRMAVQ